VLAEEDGFWKTCAGCAESNEGYLSSALYPYSDTFKCQLGGGCGDCGGIGAVWDNTDWSDFANYSLEQDKIQRSRRLELSRLANSICHVLSQKLQHRATGRDPKLNGYTYADVPEWLLRQWLERVTNVDRSLANASAIEARSDATPKSGAAEGESAGPKDDAQGEPA
jgi:hypothetical protein